MADGRSKPRNSLVDSITDDALSEDTLGPLVSDGGKVPKSDGNSNLVEKRNSKMRTTEDGRPSRYSLQEEPFNKSRVPRKSVLKRSEHPIHRVHSTYDSTHSPSVSPQSTSPDVTARPSQQDRSCCVVM